MPEAAEIRIMADCLNTRLRGLTCLGVMINDKSKFYNEQKLYSSNFNLFQKEIGILATGISRQCLCVTSYGKKIIFDFGDILIISSCGMEGHWLWSPEKYTGIILEFENGICAFYDDSSKKGNLSVVWRGSSENIHVMKEVGPDIMRDETTYEIFRTAITNNRISNKSIHEFLVEQDRISGLGNYLRSEIMYHSKIHPLRTLENLSEEDRQRLFYFAKTITLESYRKGGSTIRTYKSPDGKIGLFEPSCYGRTFDFYGNKIETFMDKKGRKVHFCPAMQF